MKFKCEQCGAAPCFLENNSQEKDPSPFANPIPDNCPYRSPIGAKWKPLNKEIAHGRAKCKYTYPECGSDTDFCDQLCAKYTPAT